jgi:hypothetical protein
MCVGLKILTDEQFFMQVECVWSLMHIQVTVLYLEETKPQQNDIHFVSSLNTVKVYSTWHTVLNRTFREDIDATID